MDTSFAKKVLRYRWLVFWIMATAYVFVYFHRLCPSIVALDLQRDLGASGAFMGILASAYFYPYAMMQFPAGLLSDSLGPRTSVTIFLIVAGAGSIAFGMASGVEGAFLARIMVGLGVAMVFTPTMKILSLWFRVQEFAFMAALVNTMGGVGAFVAATPLALTAGWLGWRASFEIIGAATLLIAALVWIFVRNRPEDAGWPSLAEINHTGPGSSPPPVVIPLWEGARQVVTERHFWPLAVWFFFLMGVYFGFGGLWAGPYLMNVYSMTRAEAGAVLNMIAVGLIVGSPLISLLSDRVLHSRRKVLTIFSMIVTGVMVFLCVFPDGLPRITLYLIMLIFSVSCAAIATIGFTTTRELFPVEIAGTSVGTVNFFPFLGGAIFQPVLGWILDWYPKTASAGYPVEAYRAILLVMAVAAVIATASTFFMKETFPGSPETP